MGRPRARRDRDLEEIAEVTGRFLAAQADVADIADMYLLGGLIGPG
ncbi:MAG: hypothetical protein M3O70_02615 [Actinomycetota bacterium]|nr:hypothetical protein [Actinomycetota bacterium]